MLISVLGNAQRLSGLKFAPTEKNCGCKQIEILVYKISTKTTVKELAVVYHDQIVINVGSKTYKLMLEDNLAMSLIIQVWDDNEWGYTKVNLENGNLYAYPKGYIFMIEGYYKP